MQEKHPHIPARRVLDRVVLGGSDGAIEAVALTAALNGAGVAFRTILIAGFAFAVAGGLSMFFSSYLSSRSEMDLLRIDVRRERMEIETEPEEEKAELGELLKKEGYDQREVDVIMGRLVKDKELWLRTQLNHELRVHMEDLATNQLVRPGAAGIAFFILALIAFSPYEFISGYIPALLLSVVLSLIALFALASRIFTPSHFNLRAGLESVAVGGVAAGLLYALGLTLSSL
ncbi:MAG: VIT1/CCC1 transporter family protein [Nitrososphaerales archaeon]